MLLVFLVVIVIVDCYACCVIVIVMQLLLFLLVVGDGLLVVVGCWLLVVLGIGLLDVVCSCMLDVFVCGQYLRNDIPIDSPTKNVPFCAPEYFNKIFSISPKSSSFEQSLRREVREYRTSCAPSTSCLH